MAANRHYSLIDKLCLGFDQALRALSDNVKTRGLAYPAKAIEEGALNDAERKHAASLMRVNHSGEICAQALYHGQAVGSKSIEIKEKMQQAAIEEGDHLAWCQQRIDELGSHTSYLNPLWYAGSFCIGMVAGMVGDRWGLGFIVETEKQVIHHLQNQLSQLPGQDARSVGILQQMEKDEATHRDNALRFGAGELPEIVKKGMRLTAAVMVKTTYWV